MITKESLRVLRNNLVFFSKFGNHYDDQFTRKDAKIGNTLDIRKPPRFTVKKGQALDVQDVQEIQETLVLDQQAHIDVVFSAQEELLDINTYSNRFLESKIAQIANEVDFDATELYKDVANAVGSPGTVPSALLTYLQAKQRLAEEAAPIDNQLCSIITPEMAATIVNALTGLFHDSSEISKQYKKGMMGISAGFMWYEDQNMRTHTSGTFTTSSTPLVNGASQTGTSLITDGWAASTAIFKRGDIITLASVNAVNPKNRQDTGSSRQFVVTDDVSSDASGDATLPISPAITPSADDPRRTVTQSPANDAVITPLGAEDTASPQGMAFHPEAFARAMVDLPLYNGVHRRARATDPQLGISIRMIEDYDINQDRNVTRCDVLYGFKTVYPELAVRIPS